MNFLHTFNLLLPFLYQTAVTFSFSFQVYDPVHLLQTTFSLLLYEGETWKTCFLSHYLDNNISFPIMNNSAMITCHIPCQLHLIKKYVGKVTTTMKHEKRFSKKGGHEIVTHSSQIFQRLWYIFMQCIWHHYGWKVFCLFFVCNALSRTKKLSVQQKISVYCTNSPILSWTAYTLKMETARSLETLIVTYTFTSSDPCPRSLVFFTKAVVTSNLVMVTYLQISNLYQRHAKKISWTSTYYTAESFTTDILGQVQVLWGVKLIQFIRPTFRKRILNHVYKISYESEYLFSVPPRALEGAPASEELWSLSFNSFMVNLPLLIINQELQILHDYKLKPRP